MDATVRIVPYEDRHAADFKRLNLEWLEGHGLLEPADLEYLDAPRAAILDEGGEILVAVDGSQVVGTCAVLRIDATTAELAKLAVAPRARGKGVGCALTLAAIERARALGAKRIVLVSSRKLTAALRLYESLGFTHAPLPSNSRYATADVCMERILESGGAESIATRNA